MTAPTAPPLIDAHVHIERAPSFVIDVNLALHAGEIVAVMGPNGAGKSTLVRALAGLEPSAMGAAVVARPATAVLLQQRALFPGLDVADNVGFPFVARGMPRLNARNQALAVLDAAGLRALAERRVDSLSGGEAQRVALERTLAATPEDAPHVLLLDEPFTALDVEHNAAMRARLRDRLATLARTGSAAVLVTHRLDDALALATRLLVLERGRVVQDAAPREITQAPATDFLRALVDDAARVRDALSRALPSRA